MSERALMPAVDEQYAALLEKIEREQAVPCSGYKDRCLRRRIGVRMRANGVHTFGEYAHVLDALPAEWEKLLAALTINVTRFFRDTGAFVALEHQAYPLLSAQHPGLLDVWSAGCSHGQEPYSLAMGLAESVGLGRFRVHATDVDATSLEAARCARYTRESVADVPAGRRERWLHAGEWSTIRPELRSRVTVARHDLLRDAVPLQRFHLIVCRNVIIYFSREAQSALFEKLHDALVPGGVLMLGKVETLVGPARERFDTLNMRERLFRRRVQ
jgi:chemotaxis methyl-accepting protein methylase